MANSITYTSRYMDMLDEIFKKESCTALLETPKNQLRFDTINDKTVYLKKITMQGLGTYSRTNGYVDGDATVEWESHTFSQERGRMFTFDAVDSIEAYTEVAELMSETMRTQIVPELDAYRFYKLYTLCGSNAAATLTYDTAIAAIDTGIAALDDLEVPEMGRVLYVSNGMYQLMKQSGDTFKIRMANGSNSVLDRDIEYFDKMPLIKVPSGRFNTSITLYDGSTGGQTDGGYVTAGYDINFMIVPVSLVAASIKHFKPKIITPQLNQSADAWKFGYRLYHDLFMGANKVNGVYIHNKSS